MRDYSFLLTSVTSNCLPPPLYSVNAQHRKSPEFLSLFFLFSGGSHDHNHNHNCNHAPLPPHKRVHL